MDALCSRPDFLGRLGRHYLTAPAPPLMPAQSPPRPWSAERRWRRRARLSLRALGSYRTLLLLLLLYLLGALLAITPLSSTLLILGGALLHGLLATLLGDKMKTH